MIEVFLPTTNFDDLLDRVATVGGAFAAQALQPDFRRRLLVEALGGAFRPHRSTGAVEESYDKYALTGTQNFTPAIADLASALAWQVRLHCGRRQQLRRWWPNDVEVHRYRSSELGITSHRDFPCNQLLIASVTLAGFAPFYYHGKTRAAEPQVWETGPGSLVLLRASGFSDAGDDRPFHGVGGPIGPERVSVIFWMNRDVWS